MPKFVVNETQADALTTVANGHIRAVLTRALDTVRANPGSNQAAYRVGEAWLSLRREPALRECLSRAVGRSSSTLQACARVARVWNESEFDELLTNAPRLPFALLFDISRVARLRDRRILRRTRDLLTAVASVKELSVMRTRHMTTRFLDFLRWLDVAGADDDRAGPWEFREP